MKWGEIKLIALEKMFLNDEVIDLSSLETLSSNSNYSIYLSRMSSTANEALQRIYSYAYPKYVFKNGKYDKNIVEKITNTTLDDYEMKTYEEACVLIPLFIASQLYKDDDISLATQYRNEFEVGLEELYKNIENNQIDIVYNMGV